MCGDIVKIAEFYGLLNQKDQAIEEMAELIQALNKLTRAKGFGQITGVDESTARLNVIEEIADVELTLYQLKYLLNIGDDEIAIVKRSKVERTLERMNTTVGGKI